MDKTYKTYTFVIWFFVAYTIWVMLNEIYQFFIAASVMNHAAMPWDANTREFMLIRNSLSMFGYAASCIVFALLAWTARGDYLSRTSALSYKAGIDRQNTEPAHG